MPLTVFADVTEMHSTYSERETGFRLGGRGRFHAILDVLGTYDTNTLYSDINPQSDFVFDITPGAEFRWNSHKLEVDSGYRFNFHRNLEQTIQNDLAHRANIEGKYRWSRRISTIVEEKFEKTTDPADVEIPERLARLTNEASAEILYSTPGKDLDFGLRYTNMYRRYDASLSALSYYNNKVSITSRVNISSHFRFLPKSVLFSNIEYGHNDFRDDPTTVNANSDSDGVTISAGIRSQFSRRFGAMVQMGTSLVFFDTGPNAYNVTGGVRGDYQNGRGLSLLFGYSRIAQISTFTNYREEHRFNLDWKLKIFRKFELSSQILFQLIDFSGPTTNIDGSARSDIVLQSTSTLKYSMRKWLDLLLRYQADWRSSNSIAPLFGTASADFLKHQISGGFSVYY